MDARNGHSTHSTSFFSFLFGFHEILSRAQTQNALKGIPTMLSKQDGTLLLLTYVRAHGRFTLLRPYSPIEIDQYSSFRLLTRTFGPRT